jgi:hypothetical protein
MKNKMLIFYKKQQSEVNMKFNTKKVLIYSIKKEILQKIILFSQNYSKKFVH